MDQSWCIWSEKIWFKIILGDRLSLLILILEKIEESWLEVEKLSEKVRTSGKKLRCNFREQFRVWGKLELNFEGDMICGKLGVKHFGEFMGWLGAKHLQMEIWIFERGNAQEKILWNRVKEKGVEGKAGLFFGKSCNN